MPPRRDVFCADAVEWLDGQTDESLPAVMTSLPDMSELDGVDSVPAYTAWLRRTAALCMRKVAPRGYCMFYQTDRRTGGEWVDKAGVLSSAASDLGIPMRWHKIVHRREQPSSVDPLRPTYSPLLCFSKLGRPGRATPDVFFAGKPVYGNGAGVYAARFAAEFVKGHTQNAKVVDPFCGQGTFLAAANAVGLDAVGVDVSAEQVEKAKALVLQL